MPEYTDQEKAILGHLTDAALTFSALPRQHPSETEDFFRAVHRARDVVMTRFAQRHEESGLTPVIPLVSMGPSGIPPSEHPATIERG